MVHSLSGTSLLLSSMKYEFYLKFLSLLQQYVENSSLWWLSTQLCRFGVGEAAGEMPS